MLDRLELMRLSENSDDDAYEWSDFDLEDLLPKPDAFKQKYKEFYDDIKLSIKEDW